MKISIISISGESDHPLLPVFIDYYSKLSPPIIQMGCVAKWLAVNSNTSGSPHLFPEKTEQQNAVLAQIPKDTDYVFYFDIDEYLNFDDLESIFYLIEQHQPTTISFQLNHFWKGPDFIGTGGDGWAYEAWCPRVFKYIPGMQFERHRPPRLVSPDGRDLLNEKLIKSSVRINHYSYIYDLHVMRKMRYYAQVYPNFASHYEQWVKECYLKWTPENRNEIEAKWSVHPSSSGAKTQPFNGVHPISPEILR